MTPGAPPLACCLGGDFGDHHHHHHHHHQSLNRQGRWGTTDDFATSFLHFSLFSTALWDLPNSRPVHSLMLSSNLFLCLRLVFCPFSLCLARWFWPDLMNGRHDHTTAVCVSLRSSLLTIVKIRRSALHLKKKQKTTFD